MRRNLSTIPLPPLDADGRKRLLAELCLVPCDDFDDAVQEAWVAALSGEQPHTAVNSYIRRLRRRRAQTEYAGDEFSVEWRA